MKLFKNKKKLNKTTFLDEDVVLWFVCVEIKHFV